MATSLMSKIQRWRVRHCRWEPLEELYVQWRHSTAPPSCDRYYLFTLKTPAQNPDTLSSPPVYHNAKTAGLISLLHRSRSRMMRIHVHKQVAVLMRGYRRQGEKERFETQTPIAAVG